MLFEDKVALVTGGASGIGEACAKHIAAEGSAVVVADLDEHGGARVVAEIEAAGGRASFWKTDVSEQAQVDAVVAHAVSTYGGLHLAVNNAGIGHAPAPLHEVPLETFDRLTAINLRGALLCLRAELAHMVDHGGGSIVNMASGTGLKASAGLAAYVMTKHGLVGLTRNAALDYATKGIRVNAVAPGTIATPQMQTFPQEQQDAWARMIPMGRLGTPDEIAESTVFLLSDKASFTSGVVLEADGVYMQGSPH
jgi:NAD(P)-dependent dehydrogenase (short-subunit alcohol dehydrogenase family)